VVPVYRFGRSADDALAAAQDAPPLRWSGPCEFRGGAETRTIGNTHWLESSSGLQRFRFRCGACGACGRRF